jgi:hypothetical protein
MCGIKVHFFFVYAKIRFKIKSKNRLTFSIDYICFFKLHSK